MCSPIRSGQTISPPFMVASEDGATGRRSRSNKVLEVGASSGCQAAILSELVKEAYTIEIADGLSRWAASTSLRRCSGVRRHAGPLSSSPFVKLSHRRRG